MLYWKIMFVVIALLSFSSAFADDQQQEIAIQQDVIRNGPVEIDAGSFELPVPPPGSFMFISSLMEMGDKVVKGAPYSADTVTERLQTLSDGNRISHKNSCQVFRDAEGRIRREQTFGMIGNWVSAERPQKSIFINDPVAGTHYVLDPENQTATKMKLERGAFEKGVRFEGGPLEIEDDDFFIAPAPGPAFKERIRYKHNAENTRTESLGKQTMEGVEVEGSRRVTVIPEGEIGNERPIEMITEKWYSPELKVYVMTRHTDPRFGETTYRLTNIKRGDQDPALFEVPAGYKITESDSPRIRIRKKIQN